MGKTELFQNKKECCGCGACESICAVGAITMEFDAEGFEYPIINKYICVKCYQCEKVCPFKECGYSVVIEGPVKA